MADVNFEELIKATNVTPRMKETEMDKTSPNLEIEAKKTNQDVIKLTNYTKIAPKQASITKSTGKGQVVIIQGPTGTPVPVRISGGNVNTTAVTNKQTPLTIQVLKMPDGSMVQLKNNKNLNLTNLSNVTQLHIGTKVQSSVKTLGENVVVKSISGGTPVTITQGKTLTANGKQILKSLTLAEAQKAGIIKTRPGEIIQKASIRPLNTIPKIITSSASNTLDIINKDSAQKNKTENTIGGAKQIVVPHQLLKLSPTTKATLQPIKIPGKPGVQYVRVVGTANSLVVPSTSRVTTNAPTKKIRDWNTLKMTIMPTTDQKIIIQQKGKHSLTSSSQDDSQPPIKITKQLTTVPTLQKINEKIKINKAIILPTKTDDNVNSNMQNLNHLPQTQTSKAIDTDDKNKSTETVNNQILTMRQEFFQKSPAKDENEKKDNIIPFCNKKLFSVLKPEISDEPQFYQYRKSTPSPDALRRKHCNCTKSQCLKLYCDCFANGEFCQDCNCKDCFNNLEYEDERQKAIRICLERNPNAFKPKITKARDQSDLRLHNKGCNCKRSSCLKNYCECYEAKITCSSNCKCIGCKNIEDRSDVECFDAAGLDEKITNEERFGKPAVSGSLQSNKQPYNFITPDVVDATIQCMIAQADECKKSGLSYKASERMVIEEMGRCLVEIIDFSIRNMDN